MENAIIPNPERSMLLLEEEVKLLKEKLAVAEEALRLSDEGNEELSRKAFYDQLTGLQNRTAFDEEMKHVFGRIFQEPHHPEKRSNLNESNEKICLVVFDLDKFHDVNEKLGHSGGDTVLKKVAETIRGSIRDSDLVARWGGEEISAVLFDIDLEQAVEKVELIRKEISEIVFDQYPGFGVTISAGVASASGFKNEGELFEAADKALYKSKNDGRNRVTAYMQA